MFITLLIVTFLIALSVSAAIARFFATPVRRILSHIVADDITFAWSKYIWFAILVVGVSSGVRVWELERYITPMDPQRMDVLVLTRDRWVLEVYRTIIGSLQGIAWLLLVFFVFGLIAYVIVRVGEGRIRKRTEIDG
jgi:ligand-binding sensor domain-containing protein